MNNRSVNYCRNLVATASLILVGLVPVYAGEGHSDNVAKAYELRMHGKADEARDLLQAIVAEDPENAQAWHELARTRQHMGLANPRQMMESMGSIQEASEKSVELDPDNYAYASYNAAVAMFVAYPSLMRKAPDVKEQMDAAIAAYEAVLDIRPDCPATLLTLTELSFFLHKTQDGDLEKAEAYAAKLESIDPAYGAKARELLLPDDADRLGYWTEVGSAHPGNADIRECLCRATLISGEMEDAVAVLESTLLAYPEKTDLYLVFARYHMMQGMRNEKEREALFETATTYFDKYLEAGPVDSLKAWVIGAKAIMARRSGDQERGQEMMEAAKRLDPFYSKASGIPPEILFTKPGQPVQSHVYWFRFI